MQEYNAFMNSAVRYRGRNRRALPRDRRPFYRDSQYADLFKDDAIEAYQSSIRNLIPKLEAEAIFGITDQRLREIIDGVWRLDWNPELRMLIQTPHPDTTMDADIVLRRIDDRFNWAVTEGNAIRTLITQQGPRPQLVARAQANKIYRIWLNALTEQIQRRGQGFRGVARMSFEPDDEYREPSRRVF